MWVESVVEVGDEPVGLRIERLDGARQERTAATLAWATVEATGGEGPEAWEALVRDLVREHVAFTLADDRADERGPEWWSEAVAKALVQFLRTNELAPRITWHVEALWRMAREPQAGS